MEDSGRDPERADRRTARRRHGDEAESVAAIHLAGRGWSILAAQLRVGRDEIDLLALEPGTPTTPATLVVIEVRSRSGLAFGAQEERVDAGKVRRLYRAAAALRAAGRLPDGTDLRGRAWRVDLLAVDLAPSVAGQGTPAATGIRHLRGLIPR
jgi:putative endonuclease